ARFKALVGNSPMNYIKDRRMLVAAKLLETEGLPLTIVAERVGYDSGAAFSRTFTRRFGVAPGQYRRRTIAQRAPSRENVETPTGKNVRPGLRARQGTRRSHSGRRRS